MGEEGVINGTKQKLQFLTIFAISCASLGFSIWFGFTFIPNMFVPYDFIVCGDRQPFIYSENDPEHPKHFDSTCHKEEFKTLIGKTLTFYPDNVAVIESKDILKAKFEGTYLRLDSKKQVKEIFCIGGQNG